MSKGAIASVRAEEEAIAQAIYDALKKTNPNALISGDPRVDDRVLIDGTFSFRLVGRFARRALKKLPQQGS